MCIDKATSNAKFVLRKLEQKNKRSQVQATLDSLIIYNYV